MHRKISPWIGLAFAAAGSLGAEEWSIVGPRAMGMGGAGVAITRGGLSAYWNPASFAPPRVPPATFWDVEIPVSGSAFAANDFLGEVDDIGDLVKDLGFDDIDAALNAGTPLDSGQIQKVIKLLAEELPDLQRPGTGLVTQASAGVMARIGQFGFSALGVAHAGGLANVDFTNFSLGDNGLTGAIGGGNDRSGQLSPGGQAFADDLAAGGVATQEQAEEIVFQAEQTGVDVGNSTVQSNIRRILEATAANNGGSPGANFTNNSSGVNLRGILLQEYALSYAHPFFEVFSVGVNVKVLNGWTYYKPFTLRDIESPGDLHDDLFDESNREESLNWGVDVGVLVQPVPWVSLGVVGRNLNNPDFDFKGPGDYEIERQVRAGIGFSPFQSLGGFLGLTLAADIDVLRNHSEALPGYKSQLVGGGAELGLGDVLFLRAGVSKNLSESEEDLMLHAGLGFRLWVLSFDLAASLIPDFTEISTGGSSNDVPERAGVSFQLGINLPLN